MISRFAFYIAACLSLAACQDAPSVSGGGAAPSPLLYEVLDESGATEGWLFGTIHALPDGTQWRTAGLEQAIDEADLLVVEIANLADNRQLAQVFNQLATSPDQPEIALRVPEEDRPALFDLIRRSNYRASDFANIETWAAALMLAQVTSVGESSNGADRALIREFAGRTIRELEGVEQQLGIFDALPQIEQSDLLRGVLAEVEQRDRDPERLQRAWLYGEEPEIESATTRGILADKELREALLVGRNRDWTGQLEQILAGNDRPLVAVGAAHLVGAEGIPALLEQSGYTVRRVR